LLRRPAKRGTARNDDEGFFPHPASNL